MSMVHIRVETEDHHFSEEEKAYRDSLLALPHAELVRVCMLTHYRYLDAQKELTRWRDMLDKVKAEDLSSTVQEREAHLRNKAELQRVRVNQLQRLIDRAIHVLRETEDA